MNLFRYSGDDPVNRSDPDGTYARGFGWSNEDWAKYQCIQEEATKVVGGAAKRIEDAQEHGGKEMRQLTKDFEKVFGPGSATTANLQQVHDTLRGMETALRDNGQLGYFANAVTRADARANGGSSRAGWTYASDRRSIYINTEHSAFGTARTIDHAIHESSHNMGTIDAGFRGINAYRHSDDIDREYFNTLPFRHPDQALHNADTLTSFVIP